MTYSASQVARAHNPVVAAPAREAKSKAQTATTPAAASASFKSALNTAQSATAVPAVPSTGTGIAAASSSPVGGVAA